MTPTQFDLSFPVRGLGAETAIDAAVSAETLGWRGVWCSELFGLDAFVVLGAVAARTRRVRIGTGAVPATTRSAAVLAMGASSLAQLAEGRVVLGIGASTPTVVADRHDRPLREPLRELRGIVEVVRSAVRGDTVDHADAPRVTGLRIEAAAVPPKVYLAAMAPRLTLLAHAACDGLVLNMLPFDEAVTRAAAARRAAKADFETTLLVRTHVEPTAEDLDRLRLEVAGYLRVPAYARALATVVDIAPIRAAPDVRAAAALVDDDLLGRFVVTGSATSCRERLVSLQRDGVTALVVPPAHPRALFDAITVLGS